jgi:hypothetical protein
LSVRIDRRKFTEIEEAVRVKGSILNPLLSLILLGGILDAPFAQKREVAEQDRFVPNEGQWHSAVRFKSNLKGGAFYLEEKGFTYQRIDREKIAELHHRTRKDAKEDADRIKIDAHAVKVKLLGAGQPRFEREGRTAHYSNFYLGNDPEDWASGLHGYRTVKMASIYQGVDLHFERRPQGIKYSFHCKPGSDVDRIRMRYRGQEHLRITGTGALRIRTSLGTIVEKAPRAFQWIDGKKEEVPCRFDLKDSIVGFGFPQGYSKDHPLIIDPNVIFSSYTGSTVDNWGNTATYDSDGALYAGGTVFGSGYPTTIGAYQLTFGGGQGSLGCDVSISKFAPDGTKLIYSTYLGGSANELPHSLVVGPSDRLYILGSTGSNDFPVDSNAVLPAFSGGTNATALGGKFNCIVEEIN